jgi:hypothetical protein
MAHKSRLRSYPIIFGAVLALVAACGGAAAPTATSPAAAGTPLADVVPTTAPAATSAAVPTTTAVVPTAAAGSADACSLASASDVSTAFGITVTTTTPTSDPTWSYCLYATSDSDTSVTTLWSTNPIVLSSLYGGYKGDADSSVSGVGDDAFWLTSDQPGGLWFKKGQTVFVVSPNGAIPNDLQASATTLAKQIASRL